MAAAPKSTSQRAAPGSISGTNMLAPCTLVAARGHALMIRSATRPCTRVCGFAGRLVGCAVERGALPCRNGGVASGGSRCGCMFLAGARLASKSLFGKKFEAKAASPYPKVASSVKVLAPLPPTPFPGPTRYTCLRRRSPSRGWLYTPFLVFLRAPAPGEWSTTRPAGSLPRFPAPSMSLDFPPVAALRRWACAGCAGGGRAGEDGG